MRYTDLFESDDAACRAASPEKLLSWAKPWSSVVPNDPPEAQHPAEAYYWTYDPAYPIAKINGGDEWGEFLKSEMQMWAEDGDAHRYDDMLDRPIEEAIFIVEVNGVAWLWDGCHRTGATVLKGLPTIRAIVGRLK
jgi:hypothetical protein